ncbi:Tfp pilus assembly protein PilO [Herbaspirillum sp. CF444]|uniref:type 4a pilus biogenesis protein PilO n=1 Tax=Herbaspirillum sp. CF444 TaxID=1144319 RepID=UPI0002727E97|nr:type 4a pilus biogenesis protein PilO [Herbaspirillum sp. CF444]EJL88636.1 Tfp pilus assembly protein PilO [Herbaspirillum sp. CF444]
MNRRQPGNWPPFQQALIGLAAFSLVVLLGWQSYLQPARTRLKNREQEERVLKNTYETKMKTATDLPLLQNRQRQAADALHVEQRHLASSGDGNAALQDIAAAAQTHGLAFESARPGQTDATADYMVRTVGIRLRGRYHDVGRFAASMAGMPHIVVLSDLQLSAHDDGTVAMDAVALSYHHPHTESPSAESREATERNMQ